MKSKLLLLFFIIFISNMISPSKVAACHYDKKTSTFYCKSENGANAESLSYAKHVKVKTFITNAGRKRLYENINLKTLLVNDISNFSKEEINKYYPKMVKGDIGLAALLFSYENRDRSIGNDGTRLYKKVIKKLCPKITVRRSCATVVSAALNAAGITDYTSASVAGLLSYFASDNHWHDLGALPKEKLRNGDIIYIDRKSHAKSYKNGSSNDSEEIKTTVIHDHVLVWTGNDVVRRYFPDSDGNSVSGSYSENYKTARSAAVGVYNLTGDYHVFRYKKDQD